MLRGKSNIHHIKLLQFRKHTVYYLGTHVYGEIVDTLVGLSPLTTMYIPWGQGFFLTAICPSSIKVPDTQ